MPVNRHELKIFITFFLIYALFVRGSGMPGESMSALVNSIWNGNTLSIDRYANMTSDRAVYDDMYYSDKEPGLPLMSLLPYAISKAATLNLPFEDENTTYVANFTINGVGITHIESPQPAYLAYLIIFSLLSSVLINSLAPVIIYKTGNLFFNRNTSLFMSFVYGLASLSFHYAISFFPYGVSTFLAFFSFYIIAESMSKKTFVQWKAILAGILGGLSAIVSLNAAPIAILLFLYVAYVDRKRCPWVAIGLIMGIMPFLTYNLAIFGNPIELMRTHLDPAIFPNLQENIGMALSPNNLYVAYRLLVDPYRGLFFYYPVYLLSLIGIAIMYNEGRKLESLLVASVFLSTLALTSSWWAWWHGGVFGPRFMLFSMPFLTISMGAAIKKVNKYVIIALLMLSIFSNLIGLSLFYEDDLKDLSNSSQLKAEFASYVYSFKPLPDVLADYYLPAFLKSGPRSRLIEELMSGTMPDIRMTEFSYYDIKYPFVNMVVFLAIPLFWSKEIMACVSDNNR